MARSARGLRAAALGHDRASTRPRFDQRWTCRRRLRGGPAPHAAARRRQAAERPAHRPARRVLRRRRCAPDVLAAVRAALAEFEKLGATLVDVAPAADRAVDPGLLPHRAGRGLVATWRASTVCATATAPARLQRPAATCTRKSRAAKGFGAEVTRRIMIGTYVLCARLLRRLLPEGAENPPPDRARTSRPLPRQCDIIAGPVAPHRGLEAGRESATTQWRTTWPTSSPCRRSLAGLPGMSVPAGFGDAAACRSACSSSATTSRKAQLLHAAHPFQRATDWHQRVPAGIEAMVITCILDPRP